MRLAAILGSWHSRAGSISLAFTLLTINQQIQSLDSMVKFGKCVQAQSFQQVVNMIEFLVSTENLRVSVQDEGGKAPACNLAQS